MKYSVHIIKALIILGGISSSFYCSGQCESITLKSQHDVDNFIKTYGPCTTVNSLYIIGTETDITNLDSLYTIEYITNIMQISAENYSSLINIGGMRNLKFVNNASLNKSELTGQFSKLEEVRFLNLSSQPDALQFFPALKHIHRSLNLGSSLTEEHTPVFTTGSDFRLYLSRVSDSTSLKLLSRSIKSENLRHLKISKVDSFNLSYLPVLDSLKWMNLEDCLNSDFTAISSLKYLEELELVGYMTGTDFGDGLKHIKNLNKLKLFVFKDPDFLTSILPSLGVINSSLTIEYSSIPDLSLFEEIEPPYQDGHIEMTDNRNLKDCNSTFLCKALKRYPENVIIKNNTAFCIKKDITKYCSTVSTDDIHSRKLRIYPNPVAGYINIEGIHQNISVRMFDISGKPVDILYDSTSGQIDIHDIPNGIYILETDTHGNKERYKIVKAE